MRSRNKVVTLYPGEAGAPVLEQVAGILSFLAPIHPSAWKKSSQNLGLMGALREPIPGSAECERHERAQQE